MTTLYLAPIAGYKIREKIVSFLMAVYNEETGDWQSVAKIAVETETLPKIVEEKPPNYFVTETPDVWFEPSQRWEVVMAELRISPIHTAAFGWWPNKGIGAYGAQFVRVCTTQMSTAYHVLEAYLKQFPNGRHN